MMLLAMVALLPQMSQAQYVDSQRMILSQNEAEQSRSGTMIIVQSLKEDAVAIMQGLQAELIIPESMLNELDDTGLYLVLHDEAGHFIFETTSFDSVTILPTAGLSAGTYALAAEFNTSSGVQRTIVYIVIVR